MKFIAIKDGFSIKKDEIIAVIKNSEGGTTLKTREGSYPSGFSYETILQLLEMDGIEEKISNQVRTTGSNMNEMYKDQNFFGQSWRG